MTEDGAVDEHAREGRVGQGLRRHPVADDGIVGLDDVDLAVAGPVIADGPGHAVRARRRDRLVGEAAVCVGLVVDGPGAETYKDRCANTIAQSTSGATRHVSPGYVEI